AGRGAGPGPATGSGSAAGSGSVAGSVAGSGPGPGTGAGNGCSSGGHRRSAGGGRGAGAPQPGVQDRVHKVHDQVDQHEHDRGQHYHGHQDGGVAGGDGQGGQLPDAHPGEDGLGHDRATDQLAELQPGHGQGGQQGVSGDGAPQQPPGGGAAGAGHGHEGLGGDLVDRTDQHLGERGGDGDRERRNRQ